MTLSTGNGFANNLNLSEFGNCATCHFSHTSGTALLSTSSSALSFSRKVSGLNLGQGCIVCLCHFLRGKELCLFIYFLILARLPGMWDPSSPIRESNLHPLHWQSGVVTTRLPEKPLFWLFLI